jgi:hypothetical protein
MSAVSRSSPAAPGDSKKPVGTYAENAGFRTDFAPNDDAIA